MATVSFQACSVYEPAALDAALAALLQPLGGLAAIVKPGDRVLLKPNLLTGARPERQCTTHPQLVAAVARQVQAVGGQPFLGDSPAFGSAAGVARANGLWQLAQDWHIPIVEFQGDRYAVPGEFGHLRLSREAMGADVLINLPKVKSHCQLTLTLGVKNLFGCVPGKMKAWWHLEAGKDVDRFARMLVETARTLAPQLTIADGIVGHEGNGPSHGEPRFLGFLGAATDVFALDAALVQCLGVDPATLPTLRAAAHLGLTPATLDWQGTPLAELQVTDWRLPPELMPIDFGLPRVLRSTLKHLYIRYIKEPLRAYTGTRSRT
ncbi:MAG: DUF362 domain-containing protein [Pseudanabaenaceae cyanobacterium]